MTVKLPKTPDQEVEANDLEMVLDGVSQLPKCTAFGRDVCILSLLSSDSKSS